MTYFKILLPNTTPSFIPLIYAESFIFTEDINKLYSGAKLVLKELGSEMFEVLKTGQSVDIVLYGQNDVEYTNHMKVMQVNRVPVPNSALISNVEVTLISSWYFEPLIETKVYRGNVGNIISEIYERKFKNIELNSSFSSTSEPVRIRYQIAEKTQNFMKRLIPYGSISNYPLYLYTDSRNTLNLKGLNDFINSYVKYAYVSDYVSTIQANVANATNTYNTIRMKGYRLNSSSQLSSSKQTTYFTTDNFVCSSDKATSSKLANAETSNSLSKVTTPPTIKYTNWAMTPQDALNATTKQFYDENLDIYTLSCTLYGFAVDEAKLGGLIKVVLPKSENQSEEANGSAGYVIQHVDYVWQGDQAVTNILMFLARY